MIIGVPRISNIPIILVIPSTLGILRISFRDTKDIRKINDIMDFKDIRDSKSIMGTSKTSST